MRLAPESLMYSSVKVESLLISLLAKVTERERPGAAMMAGLPNIDVMADIKVSAVVPKTLGTISGTKL